MAISTVNLILNGQTYSLTQNTGTGKWEATINAPQKSSYPLDGHTYGVEVIAADQAGNRTSYTEGLRVYERNAPTITVISPTAGATLGTNLPTISFRVTDDDSGVDPTSIEVTIDGGTVGGEFTATAIDGGCECVFTPGVALSDGSHTVTISAADFDGNQATPETMTIRTDTTPPTLNLTSPAVGLVTNQVQVVVSGTTNDATSSPVTVTVNEADVTVNGDGSFSTTVDLVEGQNTIEVVATDAAGQVSTVVRAVELDTAPPVFGTVTLTPNPVDAGKTFIISVVVADG